MRTRDLLKVLLPLGKEQRRLLKAFSESVTKRELSDIRFLTKTGRAGFYEERLGGKKCPDTRWPQLNPAVEEEEVTAFVKRVNQKAADKAKIAAFRSFRKEALKRISQLVAPNLVGMESVKHAAAAQLFAQEPFHILLLGDPGTGKTEILRGAERLAPRAIFGLGSGASKAGLIGSYEGKEFIPGLLVEADEGLALIDELNLLKKEDRAGLYSAMEKGFVTLDKGGKHEKFDARVRVLSTANPKADKFVGKDVKFLKTQLPFDEALLSRFHLLFLMRKASGKELETITRKIVRSDVKEVEDGDSAFVKEYVSYAEKLNVAFDDRYESMIVDFIEEAKKLETLVEVGPRTVIGIIRIAKAFARARLARHVSGDDIEGALKLMKNSLKVEATADKI